MKRILLAYTALFIPLMLLAQEPEGSYNPFVNAGTISPSPLYPVEVNGTGEITFNFGNTGSDPLEYYVDQYVILTITLSYGVPDNIDPIAAISGTASGLFTWTYNAGTYTAHQNAQIPASYLGSISIAYRVTQNSAFTGMNGFNVNITPSAYQMGSNSADDDQVSSYTYTEIRDYGDAPASYGEADHIIDFSRFLGSEIDGEENYLASDNANGDDANGIDDEDGVTFPTEMHRGETIGISVTNAGLGYLNAWIDWNGDGNFSDAGEQVVTNEQRFQGTADVNVTVPSDAIISAPTFARFRFSPDEAGVPTGSVDGGEVEDYQVTILCDPPTPTLEVNEASFCEGTEITFTAGGGTSYEFRVDGVTAQTGSLVTYTTDSLSDGQVVDVIVSDDINCSSTSDGLTVAVLPLPVSTLSSSDADNAFCAGEEITFSAGGGDTYDFRINGTSVQSGTVSEFTTNSLTNGQVLDVIVTDGNGCQSVSTGITNTVHPFPDATLAISDSDSTFCIGTEVVFTAAGGVNYDFRIDGLSVQDGTENTYPTSVLEDGQGVDVIVTNANNCVDTSDILVSTVLDLPVANAGDDLAAICEGETTVQLGGSYTGSADGATWTSSAGGSFSPAASDLNAVWTPPAGYSGTATLTLSTTGGSCGIANDNKAQVVNPEPTLVITDPDPVCSPLTVNLTDAKVTAGSTTGLTLTYWIDENTTEAYTSPDAATVGTYYILGTHGTTGCSAVAPVDVVVNATPVAPAVDIIDHCDGTSTLSTSASGSLSWSTGETTSSIIVNEAGTYSVTATVNGCTSEAGSGFASPNTVPAPPVVSNTVPENLCPDLTVDLEALITSITPAGGNVLYKTSNDPEGTDVSTPNAATAGTYFLFYQDADGCSSAGTEVSVTINACPPDVTPTIQVSPNIMHGITEFNLIVRITELNNMDTEGAISVTIPKDPRWSLTDGFVSTLTDMEGTALNNSAWNYSEDAVNHIFTTTSTITSGGYLTFGLRVTFNPGSTRGLYTVTSQLVSGAGGEVRVSNNVDSEKIDYFQQ